MKVIRHIVALLAVALLAASFFGIGFIACTAPPVTTALANLFSDDATSPFSRSQLVAVADATRDYSFGSHEEAALYATIYEIDRAFADGIAERGGALPQGFPDLSAVSGPEDTAGLEAAFANASEMYCYSPDTMAHLDDCNAIARMAYPGYVIVVIVALACLIATGILGNRRAVAAVLLASGIVVLVAFASLGAWAALDFTGLFATFHQLFFSQGNWVFPYDSLLICALPTAFWMGMAVVWLLASALTSILSLVIGAKLRRGKTG